MRHERADGEELGRDRDADLAGEGIAGDDRPGHILTPESLMCVGLSARVTSPRGRGRREAPGEGIRSHERPQPLTRIASVDAIRPLPQGERWTVELEAARPKFVMRQRPAA